MLILNIKHNKPHHFFKRWGLFLVFTLFSQNAIAVNQNDASTLPLALPNTSLVQAALPEILENDTMAWPLLPNEAVEDLAKLFYPKHQAMQTLFISRTLALNNAAFDEKDVSPQVVIILIPELKSLANAPQAKRKQVNKSQALKSETDDKRPWNKPLSMSYTLKDAAEFFVSPALVLAYEQLLERNNFLKAELDKLNTKLAGLQALMSRLLAEAERLFGANQGVDLNTMSQTAHPVAQQAVIKENVANVQPLKPTHMTASSITKENAQNRDWQALLWMPILPIVLLVSLIIAIAVANRRKIAELHAADAGLFNSGRSSSGFSALGTDAFNEQVDLVHQEANALSDLDFSLTKSEYKGEQAKSAFTYQEESEQILEQAQMYVSFGRMDVAIGLLRAQIKTMPKASLRHWLYLLDIYRDTNKQAEFEESARDLHSHYNVAIPTWQAVESAVSTAQSLEEYPHIMEVLTKIWMAEPDSAKTYLAELLTDTRQNERAGFSMAVFEDIVLLDSVLAMREKMATNPNMAEDLMELDHN